jgi:uncharacterized protein YodC (DUF2158 family)/DNA-binding XRE family transcriptional regulator
MALKLGISRATLYNYEADPPKRFPDSNLLQKYVEAFNVDANWLLLGVGDPYRGVEMSTNVGEPEPSYGIAVGDQVQLAIGGPDMVVIAAGGGCVTCAWHDSTGAMCREELPTSVVRKV